MSLRVSASYRPDRPNLFAAFEVGLPPVVAGRGRGPVREGPKGQARQQKQHLQEKRRAMACSVREILGSRLDDFMMGPIRKISEERYGVPDKQFLTLFNDIAELLFPTEWDEEDADRAEHVTLRDRKIAAGLMPVAGLDRVGTPAIEAYRDELVRWEDED